MLLKFVTLINNDTMDWWVAKKHTVCEVRNIITYYNMATVESF